MTKSSSWAWRAVPAAALSFLILACAGDDGGTDPDVPELASIEIDVSAQQLVYGTTATASATLYDEDGDEMEGSVAWSSSDQGVFVVSADGTIQATGTGVAELRAAAGGVDAEISLEVVPVELELTSPDASVTLYGMVDVVLPGAIAPPAGAVPGAMGSDTLWFFAVAADTLRAPVVNVPTGASTVFLEFDANHRGVLVIDVAAPPVVGDADAIVDDVGVQADSVVSRLEAELGPDAPGLDVVRALAEEYAIWRDTASAESRAAVAQFIAANPALLDLDFGIVAAPHRAASPGGVAGIASQAPVCSRVAALLPAQTIPARFVTCGAMLYASSFAVSLGIKALPVCQLPATPHRFAFCLAAMTAVVGGGALAYNSAEGALELPGAVLSWALDVGVRLLTTAPANGAASAADAVDVVMSGESYELTTSATYRSVIAADADVPGELGHMAGLLTTFDAIWNRIVGYVDALPSLLRNALPDLDPAPGLAPATPAYTVADTVAAQYLTVTNPSANVDVAYDAGTREFVVALKEGIEGEYTFDLAYESPVESFVQQVNGTVRVEAAIEEMGGDGQAGTPGEALPEPLVVRVVDVAGDPVNGVPIDWTVVAGGGSVAGGGTTDEDGTASATWTLGPSDGAQLVQATAKYGDGTHVEGGPVSFSAGADTTAAIELVSGDGQEGTPGNLLPNPIVVRVTSTEDGSPIEGAAVTWTVVVGDGSMSGAATTDATGEAAATWTMGDTRGATIAEVRATVDGTRPVMGSPVTVTATNALNMTLAKIAGDEQTGDPNAELADPLVVRVVDQQLLPVAGQTIEWAVVEGDGFLSTASTVTNESGEAEVYWTLGDSTTGAVEASLRVNGVHVTGSPVRFTAGADAGGVIGTQTIATGEEHSCALATDGRAYCWGGNDRGQLGTGDASPRSAPTAVVGDRSFAEITAGYTHTCALDTDGAAWCWGMEGMLGDGSFEASDVPVAVAGGHRFTTIAAGLIHTCAVDTDGAVWCWGANDYGQLGTGSASGPDLCSVEDYSFACAMTPVRLAGERVYQAVGGGQEHACALDVDGGLWCWGNNSTGALGNDEYGDISGPVAVVGGHAFSALGLGEFHSCAIDQAGAVWCWGSNSGGRLGRAEEESDYCFDEFDNESPCSTFPIAVEDTEAPPFVRLDAGESHGCAVGTNGSIWCWGDNEYGKLGTGDDPGVAIAPVESAVVFSQVSASEGHTCAIDEQGRAWCWGAEQSGNLGFTPVENCGDEFDSIPCATTPRQVGGGVTFRPAPRDGVPSHVMRPGHRR